MDRSFQKLRISKTGLAVIQIILFCVGFVEHVDKGALFSVVSGGAVALDADGRVCEDVSWGLGAGRKVVAADLELGALWGEAGGLAVFSGSSGRALAGILSVVAPGVGLGAVVREVCEGLGMAVLAGLGGLGRLVIVLRLGVVDFSGVEVVL